MNDIVVGTKKDDDYKDHYFNEKTKSVLMGAEMANAINSKARHSNQGIPNTDMSPEKLQEETFANMFENPMSGAGMSIREESSVDNYDR